MASLGQEGVSRVQLVSSSKSSPFDIPHTLGNITEEFKLSLATRTFPFTSERFFSIQNILSYHASRSILCISLYMGLLIGLETSKTVLMVLLKR